MTTVNQPTKGPQGPKGPSKYTDEYIEREADALLAWMNASDDNVFLNKFTKTRDYEASRLNEFAKKNDKFLLAFKKAKDHQEEKMFKMALEKKIDINFVKYFLPRMIQDRPHWKASWDQQEQVTQIQTPNVTINKIVRSEDSDE